MSGTGGHRSLGGAGVLARPGVQVVVLASMPVGVVVAAHSGQPWVALAVVVSAWWTAAQSTRRPRSGARRPVGPPATLERDWERYQRRSEALRAAQAPRWTQPDPAVLRYAELTGEETALVLRIQSAGYTLADGIELVERRRTALGAS